VAQSKADAQLQEALRQVLTNSGNLTEGAAYGHMSYMTLRERVKKGLIPSFSVGREVRVWFADVDAAS
jgi:hypothetical protein